MCAAKLMGIFKKCLSTQDKKQNVLYFPGAASSSSLEYEREMALHRERERTLQSLPTGSASDLGGETLNLPVSIPISQDGEEGYSSAQQRLLPTHINLNRPSCDREVERESVHPPPNRTVFDGESPPPYRSQRSLASRGSPGAGGGGGGGTLHGGGVDSKHTGGKKPNQVSNNGLTVRCYNGVGSAGGMYAGVISNNNNTTHYNPNLNSAQPHSAGIVLHRNGHGGVVGGSNGGVTTTTHHPSHQYHPPHVFTQHPHNGIGAAAGHHHPRAPHHNHRQRLAADGTTSHSRHSSGSSSSSGGSSLGSPPNYNDVIANSNYSLLSDATQRSDTADV